MIDHCIAAINTRRMQENYEIYMTDAAYAIVNGLYGGKAGITRYYDVIHPQPVDNRTGEEIAAEVIARLGLKAVE